MALHARLVAPPPPPRHEWPWHQAKWSAVPSNVFWQGDRRMEAETYLSSGYGLRVAIEGRPGGWKRFDKLARVWQPSRLKGIQVSPEFGTPFLAATQVFDIRPVSRKWLAARTHRGFGTTIRSFWHDFGDLLRRSWSHNNFSRAAREYAHH